MTMRRRETADKIAQANTPANAETNADETSPDKTQETSAETPSKMPADTREVLRAFSAVMPDYAFISAVMHEGLGSKEVSADFDGGIDSEKYLKAFPDSPYAELLTLFEFSLQRGAVTVTTTASSPGSTQADFDFFADEAGSFVEDVLVPFWHKAHLDASTYLRDQTA